ncbi:MAG: adenosylmethionine decarboxylase [Candidatus Aenigmatarchaeota archaeon]
MKVVQLIIDAHGCTSHILNNEKLLLKILKNSVKLVNAKIVKENVYKYKPYGVSITLFLAETHISIFTWPEFKYATIEIFLCNEKMNPLKVWKFIKKKIKPKKFKLRKFVHLIGNKKFS